MRYMVLIYDQEQQLAKFSEGDSKAFMKEYSAYSEAMTKAGVMREGAPLQPTHTATTVRLRDGKTLKTDGPFAETKEQLGGYYVIDCKDLDEALGWAAKCPSARMGSIEVRPVGNM